MVRAVGGLVKVQDNTTGFSYREHSSAALGEAMARAMHLYRHDPEKIALMQQSAVARIHELHTWPRVMKQYLALYKKAQERTRCR